MVSFGISADETAPKTRIMAEYSVTLTGGNNATASGGSLTQWVPFVEMNAVTYTADGVSKFKEFGDITN